MISRGSDRRRFDHGQSLVETVIMLPVLLMVFLGLDFFFELTAMRARAVEAARYATWQSAWYLRDDGTQFGAVRGFPASANTDANLIASLQNIGIGRFLTKAKVAAASRTLNNYSDDINKNANVSFTDGASDFIGGGPNPRIVSPILVGGQSVFDGLAKMAGAEGDAANAVSGLTGMVSNIAGEPGFFLQDLMARETNWKHEADSSVFTARVDYHSAGINYFQRIRPTDLTQFSSILSHPLLIVRTDDPTEYQQLVGSNGLGDCASDDGKGHIFDLWFAPTGDPNLLGGVGSAVSFAGSTGKCMFASIGSAMSAFDAIGANAGFHVPDGTLKEFPELNQ